MSPNSQPLRILLVEDHGDTLRALMSLLQRQGHIVMPAANMKTALAAAQESPFDVLVTDIGLPDGDGWELMMQLRLRHPLTGVAMSGFGAQRDRERSREAGFAKHLVKPFDPELLRTALREIADARPVSTNGAALPGEQ